MSYIHARGVIHRNIKPANLVFPVAGSKYAKLIDFGSSADTNTTDPLPLKRMTGTL